jgi:hypothetical protein
MERQTPHVDREPHDGQRLVDALIRRGVRRPTQPKETPGKAIATNAHQSINVILLSLMRVMMSDAP